jgi:hypothetical protein
MPTKTINNIPAVMAVLRRSCSTYELVEFASIGAVLALDAWAVKVYEAPPVTFVLEESLF